jgi:hypothetical protein
LHAPSAQAPALALAADVFERGTAAPGGANEKYKFTPELQREALGHKPPIDLAGTTAVIDAIMQDPSLSKGDEKQRLEQIRKTLGLSKSEMRRFFTGRLGQLYKQSAQRLDEARQAHKQQLEARLRQVEKVYGKKSPQAEALGAEIKTTDAAYRQEVGRLRDTGQRLWQAPMQCQMFLEGEITNDGFLSS